MAKRRSYLDALAHIESGNQNIYSRVDPDVSGPGTKSQGYFQITTPTWHDFAPKAGVDIRRYPNAMSAPRDVQARVAATIPLGRFGPRTQRLMRAEFGNLSGKHTAVGAGTGAPSYTEAANAEAEEELTQIASADPDYYGGTSALSKKTPSEKRAAAFQLAYDTLDEHRGKTPEFLTPLTSGGYQAPESRPTIPVAVPDVMTAPPAPTIAPIVQKALQPGQDFPLALPTPQAGGPIYGPAPGQAGAGIPDFLRNLAPGPNQPMITDFFTGTGGNIGAVGNIGGTYLRNRLEEFFTPRDQLPAVLRENQLEGQQAWEQAFGGSSAPDVATGGAKITFDPAVVMGPQGGVTSTGGGGGGGPGTSTFTIDAGTTYLPPKPPMETDITADPRYPQRPAYVDPPDRPHIEGMDWEPYLERMQQYEPQDLDRQQYMRERFLANLSRAFAAGAGGSGWSGAGGAFARFGAGFGTGTANTIDEYLAEQTGIDESQRQFGQDMENLRMRMAQADQQLAQQNAGIDYENQVNDYNAQQQYQQDVFNQDLETLKETVRVGNVNAARLYEHEVTIGQLTAPKIVAKDKDGFVFQRVNPENGNTTFEVHKFNDPIGAPMSPDMMELLAKAKTVLGEDHAVMVQARYAPLFAQGNTYEVARMMALEEIRKGNLRVLVPDEAAIYEEAAQAVNLQGIYEGQAEYPEKLAEAAATLAAAQMNLGDAEMLQRAMSVGNIGATMMLSRYLEMLQQQQPPAATTPATGGTR